MAKKTEETIEIREIPMRKKIIRVKIVGDSPLIVHAWSEKAKKEMLESQQKKAKQAKEVRDPVKEFLSGLYLLDPNGELIRETPDDIKSLSMTVPYEKVEEVLKRYQFGFPTVAFKAAMLDTAYQQGLISKKTTARGAIRILGEYAVINGFPELREDMVQIGGLSKVADLRYRPEFKEWSTILTIEFLEKSVSAEQIINWLLYAGFCSGIGEWRQSRDGSFGAFHPEC